MLDVDPNLDVDVDPYCLLKNTQKYFRIVYISISKPRKPKENQCFSIANTKTARQYQKNQNKPIKNQKKQ